MNNCTRCHSAAINLHAHGREKGKHEALCDVCYWRTEAEIAESTITLITMTYSLSPVGVAKCARQARKEVFEALGEKR